MDFQQTKDVNILNRSQLQSALNMFYTTAMKHFPHDEIVFRNNAEILQKAIDQCAPISDDNIDGISYDCQYNEDLEKLALEPQLAGDMSFTCKPQVPFQPIKYKGVDFETHKEISKDVWSQKIQHESSYYLTDEIPIELIRDIYNDRNNIKYDVEHSKEVVEYLKWITQHCNDDFQEWKQFPEQIHYYIHVKILDDNSFTLKNNVYKIEDMIIEQAVSTPEMKPQEGSISPLDL